LGRVAQPELRFTRADYDALPEGLRAELIDGELVKMAPPSIRHQKILVRLTTALAGILGVDRVLGGPVDVAIDDHNAFQPDLVVLAADAIPSDRARSLAAPLVAVEVLSPSTASRDRQVKRDLYLASDVQEVWLVDGDADTVDVCRRDGVARQGERVASRALPEVDLALAEIFRRS